MNRKMANTVDELLHFLFAVQDGSSLVTHSGGLLLSRLSWCSRKHFCGGSKP